MQFARATLLLFGFLAIAQGLAQPVAYESGVHYRELAAPLPDADPDRIEVVELFWYGCPDCYDQLPTMQLWEASYRTTDMNFARMPVIWNSIMETHARIHLTAQELGLLPQANKSAWHVTPTAYNAIFDAIHKDLQPLRTEEEAAVLFGTLGVAREAFAAAWNAEAVTAAVGELKSLPLQREVDSLPALLVDGRYLITYNEAVRTSEDFLKVLSFLVVDIRETRRRQSR